MLRLLSCLILSSALLAYPQENPDVKITKGPLVENATATSATIAWSTNVNASTILKYGTDANNLTQLAEVPWGGLTHRIVLRNLRPNTTYYFQVRSTEGQGTGTSATSAIAEFSTQNGPAEAGTPSLPSPEHSGQPKPDSQASASPSHNAGHPQAVNATTTRIVAGPIPQDVTANFARLWWATNKSTTGSAVQYGTSPAALNQFAKAADSNNGLTHTSELTNLQPGTTYTARIVRPDHATSAETSFKTGFKSNPKNVRITNGPVVERLAADQTTIAWDTSAPSNSIVKYGTRANALNHTIEAPWTRGTHRVTLSHLQPNTKYFFQIESREAKGTGSPLQGGPYPFQTIQAGQAAIDLGPQ